jgi:hypothetical protein
MTSRLKGLIEHSINYRLDHPTRLNVGSGNDDTTRGLGGSRPLTGASIFMYFF